MDGSDSLEIVKNNGGIVFIEQPFECDATAMLENAINTKKFDKILSLNDMSKLIYDKLKYENDIEISLDDFLEQIYLLLHQ
jgi:chemotaxis response regulator CheB